LQLDFDSQPLALAHQMIKDLPAHSYEHSASSYMILQSTKRIKQRIWQAL